MNQTLKKSAALLLAVVWLAASLAAGVSAKGANTSTNVTIELSDVTGAKGDRVEVSVIISAKSYLVNGDMMLRYDPERLRLDDTAYPADDGEGTDCYSYDDTAYSGSMMAVGKSPRPGVFRFNLASGADKGLTAKTEIFRVAFKILKNDVPSTFVVFSADPLCGNDNINGYDSNGMPKDFDLSYTVTGGKITIEGGKAPAFPDVPKSAWYYDATTYVAARGFITGYQTGKFGGGDMLKRQDFAVILARIAKADLSRYQYYNGGFSDSKRGSYYAPSVAWAKQNGIISGYQNGKFGVGDTITREQVCTILYRFMGSPEVENVERTLSRFPDRARISSFARTAIAWAVQNGVIGGMADGKMSPLTGASRAQIAVILMHMDQQRAFD